MKETIKIFIFLFSIIKLNKTVPNLKPLYIGSALDR